MNRFSIKPLSPLTVRAACFVALLALSGLPGLAVAEYLGLLNGRSADPATYGPMSVEAGVISGSLGTVDYQHFGVRVNSRVSDKVVVFGDLGNSQFGASDGTPFGLGVFVHLPNQKINERLDMALKASYHAGGYTVSGRSLNITATSFELLVSGLAEEGVGGYASIGVHRLNIEFGGADGTTEYGFGAGLSVPIGPGEAYAGFDFIDEVTLGVGFRYFLKPVEQP